MATTQTIIPLHLSGNMKEHQSRLFQEFLGEAVRDAYRAAAEKLDRRYTDSAYAHSP